jgi:hypothetical protein
MRLAYLAYFDRKLVLTIGSTSWCPVCDLDPSAAAPSTHHHTSPSSLVPLEHLPVQGYRDTGDTWDTRKCVSIALGNWTLRGLTSLASRDAVEVGDLLSIIAAGVWTLYATTNMYHWGTQPRRPYFCSGLAAHVFGGQPMQTRQKMFFGGYAPLGFEERFSRS